MPSPSLTWLWNNTKAKQSEAKWSKAITYLRLSSIFFAFISSWNMSWYFSLLGAEVGFGVDLPSSFWHFATSFPALMAKYPIKNPPIANTTTNKMTKNISRRLLGLEIMGTSNSMLQFFFRSEVYLVPSLFNTFVAFVWVSKLMAWI